MFRFIKNLFSGILGFIGKLFSFGKKQEQSQGASAIAPAQKSQPQKQPAATQNNNNKGAQTAYFLDEDQARGFKSTNGKQPATAQAEKSAASKPAATAKALNLPKAKVTSYSDFKNTGDRRLPGANMSSFLEMARQVKTAK